MNIPRLSVALLASVLAGCGSSNDDASSGNVDSEREARLSKQGWRMHIQRKGRKDKPLSAAQ